MAQQEERVDEMPGGNFLQVHTQPLYETQPYKYQVQSLPGRPRVLAAGENLSAPLASGVSFNIEATS